MSFLLLLMSSLFVLCTVATSDVRGAIVSAYK